MGEILSWDYWETLWIILILCNKYLFNDFCPLSTICCGNRHGSVLRSLTAWLGGKLGKRSQKLLMSLMDSKAPGRADDMDREVYVWREDGAQEAGRRPQLHPASQHTQYSHVRAWPRHWAPSCGHEVWKGRAHMSLEITLESFSSWELSNEV